VAQLTKHKRFQRSFELSEGNDCLTSLLKVVWNAVCEQCHLHISPCAGPMSQKCYSVYVPAVTNDWSCRERDFARLSTVHSMWRWHGRGTVTSVSLQHLQWLCSKDNWKLSCL